MMYFLSSSHAHLVQLDDSSFYILNREFINGMSLNFQGNRVKKFVTNR